MVSCDLTECELPDIGLGVADGQFAAASFFDSLDTPQARRLKARAAARFGTGRRLSSYFATSYATVHLCVAAALRCGSDDPAKLRSALDGCVTESPLGSLRIDPVTNHAALPFLLGRIAADGFTILQQRASLVADPYLTGSRPWPAERSRPRLRVVS